MYLLQTHSFLVAHSIVLDEGYMVQTILSPKLQNSIQNIAVDHHKMVIAVFNDLSVAPQSRCAYVLTANTLNLMKWVSIWP